MVTKTPCPSRPPIWQLTHAGEAWVSANNPFTKRPSSGFSAIALIQGATASAEQLVQGPNLRSLVVNIAPIHLCILVEGIICTHCRHHGHSQCLPGPGPRPCGRRWSATCRWSFAPWCPSRLLVPPSTYETGPFTNVP